MRPELERLRLIEQQLLNSSTALPAEDWQLRLLLDGELAADTAAQQQLYQGLRLAGRRQLRRELADIHARLYELPASPWARLWQRMKPW
ncbi:hypothetical protein [Hymenobacter properus]|uniref:Uncharacterized protein n=1 Tax=Hymenobacter properus TaxID=2791026 RepID=A0A931BP07_9BACT|nr:hypothetical protein [Hymenobacter properus]MBF9142945.1 hypothetical protein [Hymenobacter properus]MBR7721752.1 hypothetical protein [Microvirga sp. SRT04]